ncbi:unnamed protein product [Polarella glacialis]|uniref:Carboxylic ester hydrolase n=1 Tax=Polarella glacialis TaxID=89957 RepID=A0A813IDZ6_POLGL|nr:unnamed protein product [Polarella glacialis]
MALRWVQANIKGFGGDPGRVTLSGHSSGAFGVAFHLMSPASKGLFQGAITESATWDSGWYFQDKASAFTFYAELGEALSCPQDSSLGSSSSAQLQCLRGLPQQAFFNFSQAQVVALTKRVTHDSKAMDAWTVIEAVLSTMGAAGGIHKTGLLPGDSSILASPLWPALPVGIIVDGTDTGLPAPPRELYETGRIHEVPIYVNHEAHEGTLFAAILVVYPWYKSPTLTHAAVDTMISWGTGDNATFSKQVVNLYPAVKSGMRPSTGSAKWSRTMFSCAPQSGLPEQLVLAALEASFTAS